MRTGRSLRQRRAPGRANGAGLAWSLWTHVRGKHCGSPALHVNKRCMCNRSVALKGELLAGGVGCLGIYAEHFADLQRRVPGQNPTWRAASHTLAASNAEVAPPAAAPKPGPVRPGARAAPGRTVCTTAPSPPGLPVRPTRPCRLSPGTRIVHRLPTCHSRRGRPACGAVSGLHLGWTGSLRARPTLKQQSSRAAPADTRHSCEVV